MRLRQCCTRRTDLPLLLLTMAAYSDALSDAGQSSAFTAVDMEMIQKQMEDQQSSSMTSGSSETSTRRRGTDGSDAARRSHIHVSQQLCVCMKAEAKLKAYDECHTPSIV